LLGRRKTADPESAGNKSGDLPSVTNETVLAFGMKSWAAQTDIFLSVTFCSLFSLPGFFNCFGMNKILTILFVLLAVSSFAQSDSLWSLYIDEIKIISKEEHFAGSVIIKHDSIGTSPLNSKSIESLISSSLPVYVRSDAGGLATISVRGTSPDHTAIMLGCINLNSLTLGHSDLFSLPLFLFDGVDFQYGSACSMYGSDAIGGTLELKSNTSFKKGVSVSLQKDIGSFHSNFEGVKMRTGLGRFEYKFKAYQDRSLNDFTFNNEIAGKPDDTQLNAAYHNWGVWNELNLKLSGRSVLSAIVWCDNNWHEVQPTMVENSGNTSFKFMDDQNVRSILSYKKHFDKSELNLSVAYVWDESLNNGNEDERIATRRGILQAEYENRLLWRTKQLAGVQMLYIVPDVYSYSGSLTEKRADFYYSLNRSFFGKFHVSAGIRMPFVEKYNAPITPSFGMKYNLVKRPKTELDLKASVAKSYKIPTFNDRFWGDQGNPDLLPESGNSYEGGFASRFNFENIKTSLTANLFYLDVSNWIVWVNKGQWVPENETHVVSKGAELGASVEYHLRKVNVGVNANYSLTNAESLEHEYDDEKPGEDLGPSRMAYTPMYVTMAGVSISNKYFSCNFSWHYTGQRYTLTQPLAKMEREKGHVLDPYNLFNTHLMLKLPAWKQHRLAAVFSVQNLFDTEYTNKLIYAMPGRSFSLSLRYSYN